jgi:hypothetical protein
MRRLVLVLLAGFTYGVVGSAEPPDLEAWRKGLAAMDSEDWISAARHFRTYREKYPDRVNPWVMEAYCRARLGDSAETIRLYEAALERDPNDPDALFGLSDLTWRDDDRNAALERLLRIRDVREDLRVPYHHFLGILRVLLDNDPAAAIDDFSHVPGLDASSSTLLALAHLRRGDVAAAEPALAAACARDPSETLLTAWIRCHDIEYCGDLLEQRLEILRRLHAASSSRDGGASLAEVIRIHVRHAACPSPDLLARLREVVASSPGTCRMYLLEALTEECRTNGPSARACASLREAQQCAAEGGNTALPSFSGPLIHHRSGTPLDVDDVAATAARLESAICPGPQARP